MHQAIDTFKKTVIQKITEAYSKEIVSVVTGAPKSVVDFNNVTTLKKAQRYVRHTDLVFNKAIATLFLELFREKGGNCKRTSDRQGHGLYLRDEKNHIHFISLERVVGFPKVPWFQEFNREKQSDISNTYVVLVENSEEGQLLVSNMNNKTASRNAFMTFEGFTIQYFGRKLWDDLAFSLKQIESESKWEKWFDLAEVCTKTNQQFFSRELVEEIRAFDYEKACANYNLSAQTAHNLIDRYIGQKQYELIFSSEDFAKSFFTSEWLNRNYFHDDSLEKTYVMLGYLKSVEQLLVYSILKSSGKDFSGPNSIGKMLKYLENHKSLVFSESLDDESIKSIIDNIEWVKNERNDYLHKKNIADTELIREIRNRTLLLYCMILGAFR